MKKIEIEILGFFFYLFALYLFFHYPQEYSTYDDSYIMYSLKFIMLVVALPVLYIYQLAYYFNFEYLLPFFNQPNTQFEAKLFYNTINILIIIFYILEVISRFFY